jgi:hypothetical protein
VRVGLLLVLAACDGVFGLYPVRRMADARMDGAGDGSVTDVDARCAKPPYESYVDLPTGSSPYHVVLTQLDGDPHLDLLVSHDVLNRIHVRRGNGDGTFAPGAEFSAGGGPRGFAVADVNIDNVPDVVTSSSTTNVITMLGDGMGGLGSVIPSAVGAGSLDVALFHKDSDMILDVAALVASSQLVSARNGGAGVFSNPASQPVGASPLDIAVGRLDPGTFDDLVVSSADACLVTILLGSTTGFSTTAFNVGGHPRGLVIAQLDANASLDIAVGIAGSEVVRVMMNDGSGGFAGPAQSITVPASPLGIGAADFDQDGDTDLVVASTAPAITFLDNDGFGVFTARPSGLAAPSGAFRVAVGDVDGDQRPDFAVVARPGNGVRLFRACGP